MHKIFELNDVEIIHDLSYFLNFQLIDYSEIGWSDEWNMGYILKENKVISLRLQDVGFFFFNFSDVEEELIEKLMNCISQLQFLQELSLSGIFVWGCSLIKLATLNQLHTLFVNVKTINLLPISQWASLNRLCLLVLSQLELEEDLTPLIDFKNLEELTIEFNAYNFFISPLKKLSKLKRLEIDFSMVNDLQSFAEFSQLEELRINYSADKPNEYFEKYLSNHLPDLNITRGDIGSEGNIYFDCHNGFNAENQSAELEVIQSEVTHFKIQTKFETT